MESRNKYLAKWRQKHRKRLLEIARLYRKNNPENIKLAQKKYRERNREVINKHSRIQEKKRRIKLRHNLLKHYSKNTFQCACCGEKHIEFLTIDHVNGGGNEHRRQIGGSGGYNFYRWLKRNNFPNGFQVLCHNCNWAKGHYKICPHKSSVS